MKSVELNKCIIVKASTPRYSATWRGGVRRRATLSTLLLAADGQRAAPQMLTRRSAGYGRSGMTTAAGTLSSQTWC